MTRLPTLEPFAGWLVKPKWADRVISRAYDNTSPKERRAIAASNPYSYLTVTRSGEDIAEDENLSVADLVSDGAAALRRLLAAEVFKATGRRSLYLYRMSVAGHSKTGVVGTVPVSGFSDGSIRTHENVQDDRVDLISRHLRGVGATSSPVALTFDSPEKLMKLLDLITAAQQPDLEFGSETVQHQIWTVPDEHCAVIEESVEGSVLYVTDGHHRADAARLAKTAEPDRESLARTLAVLFPASHVRVEAFHRLVSDCSERLADASLPALKAAVELEPVAGAAEAGPLSRGMAGLYIMGSWYRLTLPAVTANTALAQLDVERLRTGIIDSVLHADELGRTGAVAYLPNPVGIAKLVRRCDREGRIGFVVHPMSVKQLMAVADEGSLMPPKSSFFAPKPRSGVFLRVLGMGVTADLEPS